MKDRHSVKKVRIRSYSGPYFPAFALNAKRYSVSLRIQSECRKMQTRITPNTDTSTTSMGPNKCSSIQAFLDASLQPNRSESMSASAVHVSASQSMYSSAVS